MKQHIKYKYSRVSFFVTINSVFFLIVSKYDEHKLKVNNFYEMWIIFQLLSLVFLFYAFHLIL